MRYKERILDPVNGSVLGHPDAGDQTWFYAGLSEGFAMPYEMLASYPLLAAIEKPHGYGMFAFDWWNQQRLLWTDGAAVTLSTGPAYAGMRDGWRDALLIDYAVRTPGVIALSDVASRSSASLLPVVDVKLVILHERSVHRKPSATSRFGRAITSAARAAPVQRVRSLRLAIDNHKPGT